MVKVIPSTESLLAKLWHAALLCPSGEPAEVKVDPDLSRATWPRCSGARTGTPAYDDHYVDLWSGRFREYVRRERELRGPRDVNTLIEADDPYWEQYRELIAEYRELLLQNHTPWDRFMNPQELYAEVAALYEVCYKAARDVQLQQRRMRESSQHEGEASASASASTSAPTQPSTSRICFPWRIAEQQLLEMKEKARQLAVAQEESFH